MADLKFKKILLKLSGEALANGKQMGIDFPNLLKICEKIKACKELGVDIAIVVGGGNYWRGRSNQYMDRTRADHIGMLATTMNSLAIMDAFNQLGVPARVQTAIEMRQIAEPYIRNKAIRHMEKGRIVIFGCGTGNPFFSTDTAAALRAAEINADVIFKATNVDGVYTDDPKKNPDAVRYDTLSFDEMLNKDLHVLDGAATAICRDNNIPIYVFDMSEPENIVRAIKGENIGTLVAKEI